MKIRKAILTGGGRATRLHPVTTTINKHLLPLANKPMIFHAIEKVVRAGITDIFINVNPGEQELQQYVGDGGHWGVKITFYEQTGGPHGIAHVVNEARRFIGRDPFLFYLSDNIVLGELCDFFEAFYEGKHDCMLALSQVPDPERFGVPVFDQAKRLVDVLEKPSSPPNNFAVTGMYLYGPNVFFDAFARIERSARGEYEISSIHSEFLKRGLSVGYLEITGWWKDTGKPEDLLLANTLLLDYMNDDAFVKNNRVKIGEGTTIGEDVILHGSVIVGENCTLEHCIIGPHVTIGAGSTVRGAAIKNSIILDGATIEGSFSITDSLIGKKVSLRLNGGRQTQYRMILGDKTLVEI